MNLRGMWERRQCSWDGGGEGYPGFDAWYSAQRAAEEGEIRVGLAEASCSCGGIILKERGQAPSLFPLDESL